MPLKSGYPAQTPGTPVRRESSGNSKGSAIPANPKNERPRYGSPRQFPSPNPGSVKATARVPSLPWEGPATRAHSRAPRKG